jgi:hypothetical protein
MRCCARVPISNIMANFAIFNVKDKILYEDEF